MALELSALKPWLLGLGIVVGYASYADAQHRFRQHAATQTAPLALVDATNSFGAQTVSITQSGPWRVIQSNGVPDHAVGAFPNAGNPNRIAGQNHMFRVTLSPEVGAAQPLPRGASFGVAINGVPFDPNAAEFWQGNPRSGWNYNALGGAVALGLDANYAHVQPTGAYHYHGLPIGLMQSLDWSAAAPSPLLGYAADGFPIYALTAEVGGETVRMTSSYQLKSGNRPAGDGPQGAHDGTFVEDFEYVAGSGTLDACNGAYVTSPETQAVTYAYILTDTYPVIPRCLVGEIGRGFAKR